MKKRSHPKKVGFDFRVVFRLSIFAGACYLLYKLSLDSGVLAFGAGLLAFGVIGLVITSRRKRHRPDAFEYFSPAEIIQMKMPAGWQPTYEIIATFLMGRWGSGLFVTGWFALIAVLILTRRQTILGISLSHIVLGYFFGGILLAIMGGILGWQEMAERQERERKLKPIPERGEKVELYDFASGQPLAHISRSELQFLIDSFQDWGMADNDFYIMRETLDLFEEQGADAHLVATLREMMGKKNDMEIGWTLV